MAQVKTNEHKAAQTPAEIARELRTGRRYVYSAIQSGALRAYWLGGGYRIFFKDKDAWLETLRAK